MKIEVRDQNNNVIDVLEKGQKKKYEQEDGSTVHVSWIKDRPFITTVKLKEEE